MILEAISVVLQRTNRFSTGFINSFSFVLIVIIGIIDWKTGWEPSFAVFYLIPITVVSWYCGRNAGMAAVIYSTIIACLADLFLTIPHGSQATALWNTLSPLIIYIAFVYLLTELTGSLHGLETAVNERTSSLTAEIAERKQIEKDLLQANTMLNTLIKSSPLGIALIDDKLQVLIWNPAAEKLFGWQESEVMGRSLPIVSKDMLKEFWAQILSELSQDKRTATEVVRARKDGSLINVESWIERLFDSSGNPTTYIMMFDDITDRKTAEKRLLSYHEELSALAAELSWAEERERRRFATELHDQLGQNLTYVKMKLNDFVNIGETVPDSAAAAIEEISNLVDGIIQSVRSLTFQISPPLLYEIGLASALEWLGEEFLKKHGLRVLIHDDGSPKFSAIETRTAAFHIVRELLMNIVKHAVSDKALVSLEQNGAVVRIEVTDEGIGFDVVDEGKSVGKEGGFGLFNIRQRLSHLGGSIAVQSEAGRGTRIVLQIPATNDNEEIGHVG